MRSSRWTVSGHNFSNYKVWTVGYSRGGAVIDLFGKAINDNISDYDMAPEDFYVYAFGAPRASTVATDYANIHDVKDGDNLLLGYLFPELWGFIILKLMKKYSRVKTPLSELMKIYQTRHLDEQTELMDFFKDTKKGVPYMVVINAFVDLAGGGYGETLEEALANFPPYQILFALLVGIFFFIVRPRLLAKK